MQDKVRATFEQWKRRLLDLSARNRLLHFQPTRRGTLPLPQVPIEDLFDVLVNHGQQIIFEGLPEDGMESGSSPDATTLSVITQQHCNVRLRTHITQTDLKRTLTNLHRRARESILEQGIHTLYMALGFLEWYEVEHSDVPIRSPLVLIPVALERQRGGVFVLTATGESPETNVVLAEKLRHDLSVQLPDWDEGEEGNRDLAAYLDQVRCATADLERSSIHQDAVLDIFSFAKLVMYRDLEQHTDLAMGNELVQALCGAPTVPHHHLVPSGMELDEKIGYAECFHVLDADTSQREAIVAASMGESFILVGPPGTGKSQTIANIIAECIAKGKKVLFVSEKAAALEVVYRRLEECGLHPFCLDLHSALGRKQEVLDQLRHALEFGGDNGHVACDFWAVEKQRRELNTYAKALHEPFGALGWTPFNAHGELARLHDVPEVTIKIAPVTSNEPAQNEALSDSSEWQSGLATVDGQLFNEMETVVADIEHLASFFERGKDHPWWGYRYEVVTPTERLKVEDALRRLQQYAAEAVDLCATLDEPLGVTLPETIDGVKRRVEICECLLQTRGRTLNRAWLGMSSLAEHRSRVDEATTMSNDLLTAELIIGRRYSQTVWEIDAEGLAERFRHYEQSWWRRTFTSGPDRRLLRGHLLDENEKLTFAQMTEDVQQLRSHALATQWFHRHQQENETLFGTHYRGAETDWAALNDLLQITERLNNLMCDFGYTPGLQAVVTESGILEDRLKLLADLERRSIRRFLDNLREHTEYFYNSFDVKVPEDLGSVSIVDINVWAQLHIDEFHELDTWQRYRKVYARAQQIGMARWIRHFLQAPEQVRQARDIFRKSFCLQWLDDVYRVRPALGSFAIEEFERIREQFMKLDQQAIIDGAARVVQSVLTKRTNVVGGSIGQTYTLQRELRKQRRHKPIRQLLSEIPELVQDLMPCMMMSPLTVSQYLGSDRLQFDLVVFDEASQVKPEDAVAAIMRTSQLILAGDPKQLPPTTFFESTLEDAPDNEIVPDAPLESVLDEAGVWLRERLLRWHYRSRDDSLIAFSNHEFYKNRLVTFPDAGSADELGVTLVHCANGVYDRGGSRTNQVEAQRVADLVTQIAQAHRADSIGVVAFSKAQEQAIWDTFEARVESDANLEKFLSDDGGSEPFFIKNLETVQGDERDTIIISVGYGRDAQGRLTMNFGPLNQEGGARRLNVAVTRARKRVLIVSSITAQDIEPDVSGGAQLLRRYLDFAARGVDALESQRLATAEPDTPFEEAVRCALLDRGLDVRSQVGCGPYRIDLAVVDPERPGQYLLGIECDGATYHSSQTARDRDRLREQVLENHGWRLVRIWSTDWWRNPERQVDRVMQAVEEASVQQAERSPAGLVEPNAPNSPDSLEESPASCSADAGNTETLSWCAQAQKNNGSDYGFKPYVAAELGVLGDQDIFYRMADTRAAPLLAAIQSVVNVEGPVHVQVAMKRVTEAFGISRCGSKIQSLMERCIFAAEQAGQLRRQGDFLWSAEDSQPVVRTNEGSATPRRISEFALEELALAVNKVVEMAHGAPAQDVIPAVARALGCGRTGHDIRNRIEDAISLAIQRDLVRCVGENLLPPAP